MAKKLIKITSALKDILRMRLNSEIWTISKIFRLKWTGGIIKEDLSIKRQRTLNPKFRYLLINKEKVRF